MESSQSQQDTKGEILARWIPMTAIGAGITFVAGIVLHVPPPQLLASVGLTTGLIFSGLAMHSRGRGRKQ